jgi:hypothetical protein
MHLDIIASFDFHYLMKVIASDAMWISHLISRVLVIRRGAAFHLSCLTSFLCSKNSHFCLSALIIFTEGGSFVNR